MMATSSIGSSGVSSSSASVSLIGPPPPNKLKMETFRAATKQPSLVADAAVTTGGGTLPLSRPGILKQPGKMRPISPPPMFVQGELHQAVSCTGGPCAEKPAGFNSNCQQCVAERVAVLSRPQSPSDSTNKAGSALAISQSTHSIHQPRMAVQSGKHLMGINPNLRWDFKLTLRFL